MTPDTVKLVAIDEAQASDICQKKFLDKIVSGGAVASAGEGSSSTVQGYCVYLDLTKEDDRKLYADLSAKFVASPNLYIMLWEERIKTDAGGLCIYLSYISTDTVPNRILATLG